MRPEDFHFLQYRKKGYASHLEKVYDLTGPSLLALGLQLSRDYSRAEDLMQTTYLKAISQAQSWKPKQPLMSWFTDLMTDVHMQSDREDMVNADLQTRVDPRRAEPISDLLFAELDQYLGTALESMPQSFRSVLELRIHEGLDSTEIGHRLGRTPGTVRSQLRRGVDRLRQQLPLVMGAGLLLAPDSEAGTRLREVMSRTRERVSQVPAPGRSVHWLAKGALSTAVVLVAIFLWPKGAEIDNAANIHPSGEESSRAALTGTDGLVEATRVGERTVATKPSPAGIPAGVAQSAVAGRVLDVSGRPVEGATVTLISSYQWNEQKDDVVDENGYSIGGKAVTDEWGEYGFDVAVPTAVQITLTVTKDESFESYHRYFGPDFLTSWPIWEGPYTFPDVILRPSAKLRARVVDFTGKPVAGVRGTMLPGYPYFLPRPVSDNDGLLAWDHLHPGQHTVTLVKDGLSVEAGPIVIPPGGVVEGVTWRLPETKSIRMRVVDDQDYPIQGAKIRIAYPEQSNLLFYFSRVSPRTIKTVTDRDGILQVELPIDTRVRLEASATSYRNQSLAKTVHQEDFECNFKLPAAELRDIQVLDKASGDAVEGAVVSVFTGSDAQNAKPEGKVSTDPTGMCTIDSQAGWVQIKAEGYFDQVFPWGPRGEEPTRFPLTPSRDILVRVQRDGKPAAHARAEVITGPVPNRVALDASVLRTGTSPLNRIGMSRVRANGQGVLRVRPTQIGNKLRVCVYHPDLGTAQQTFSLQDANRNAQTGEWYWPDIELADKSTLRGTVKMPLGGNPNGISLTLNFQRSAVRAIVQSDGSFEFPDLPAGDHYLGVDEGPLIFGRGSWTPIHLLPGKVHEIHYDLSHLGLSWPWIRIEDQSGIPMRGVTVALLPLTSTPSGGVPRGPREDQVLGTTNRGGVVRGVTLLKGSLQLWFKLPSSEEWVQHKGATVEAHMTPIPIQTIRIQI